MFYNFNAKNTKENSKVMLELNLIDSHLSFSGSFFDGFIENFGAVQKNVGNMPIATT